MKLRSISTGAAAAITATVLLTGVAFATSNATDTTDNDDGAAAIAKLAKTTTATGHAKGDIVSATAKATAEAKDNDADNDDEDTTDADAKDSDDTDTDDNDADDNDADSHGDTISALAKETEAGPEHGETVSAAARSGSTDSRNDGKGSTTSTDARKGHGSR